VARISACTSTISQDFALCFDTESELPVKLAARVTGRVPASGWGDEFTQEMTGIRSDRTGRNEMNKQLLESIERELLGWPGVSKEKGRGPIWVPPSTSYRVGGREIGHIHDNGVADLPFPREIHDELIAAGRAKPHPAGFPEVVSYRIRETEDVPGAVALFRLSYDRAQTGAGEQRHD
jgi:hypothetical protein